jgi:hypothetical protein
MIPGSFNVMFNRYNCGAYVAETVECALQPIYPRLVVAEGSADPSVALLGERS